MPPRKRAGKAAANAEPDAPKTPKKQGKKRAHSGSDGEEGPSTSKKPKSSVVQDGTPRRADGTKYVVPVDFMCSLNPAQVYVDASGEVYDAMLNQTNIGNNNNKFYILQLVHSPADRSQIYLYTRWGRVSENGQSQMKGPWDGAQAVKEFCKQYKSKTASEFAARHKMAPKPGKYTWLEREYEDEGGPSKSPKKEKDKATAPEDQEEEIIPDSKQPPEIQFLVNFIFNTDFMKAHLISMNYDANKLPLGKLGQSTITAGFEALKSLAEVIQSPTGASAAGLGGFKKACEHLTNRYYTVIPHSFGRQRPIVIDNADLLKRELDLVDSLSDMEVATKIIVSTVPKDENGNPINPTDSKLASLELDSISVVDRNSAEFAAVNKYAQDSNEGINGWSTHKMKVAQVFRLDRKGEADRWEAGGWSKAGEDQRLLLWHGSRTTNFVGIIRNGLKIAPPEAPVTGYEFGKGVYFGDMSGISINYTHFSLSNNTGLLLLCEVVAKPFHEAYEFDFHADVTSKNNSKVATKALGKMQHETWIDAGEALGRDDLKGVKMPGARARDLSHTFPRPSVKVEDIWNEYIIYDVSQIRIRYLLQMEF